MRDTLAHRGPDDAGLHVSGRIGLGATRLAIIDVEGGHQPVSNEDGSIWVVLNGEIYNHRQLRSSLAGEGHRFISNSDTEVLAHLYEEHGPAMLDRLRGMFALALWDTRRSRLVLARDRLGIKPMFYTSCDGALLFGSEIKALLAAGTPRRLDSLALHDYLSFDYVPGPRTMFEGIRKLPAGHVLVQEADVEQLATPEPYWDYPPQVEATQAALDAPSLTSELLQRLDDAVRATMVSDVPLGAFLSGGLDSSVVVALMARHSERPVRTFAIGFKERSYNELPHARIVAQHLGTDHEEILVEPQVEDVVHSLVEAFDEPFADSSAVATFAVSQAAARRTKVVLSGDGGDEVFGGYVIYQADRLARAYRRLPGFLTEGAVPAIVDRLPSSDSKMSWDLKLRRFTLHARRDPARAHASWRVIFTEEMKQRLYGDRPHPQRDSLASSVRLYEQYGGDDELNRFMYMDARTSLVDDMLTKVDRTSMAHSLEVRVPLLDHSLVEWMSLVPSRYKVRRLELKYLLRRVGAQLLPKQIARRPKAGFHVPVPIWLKGELAPLLRRQLGSDVVTRQGVFDPTAVDQLVAEHMSGRRDHSRNLWGLLMFSLWFERHIEGR